MQCFILFIFFNLIIAEVTKIIIQKKKATTNAKQVQEREGGAWGGNRMEPCYVINTSVLLKYKNISFGKILFKTLILFYSVVANFKGGTAERTFLFVQCGLSS